MHSAYERGELDALARYKVAADPAPDVAAGAPAEAPARKSWLPAALAAGLAGAGAYKYLRTPTFSSHAGLRALQRRATRDGFHRVVDVTNEKLAPGADLRQRALHAISPRLNDAGELDALNKLKLFMLEGSEAVPVGSYKGKTIYPMGNRDVKGVVYGRDTRGGRVRGGVDYEGPMDSQKALTALAKKQKDYEADFLNKYAPGATPHTVTDLSDFVPRGRYKNPQQRLKAVRAFKQQLTAHMREQGSPDYMLKITRGLASDGQFPLSKGDWGAHLSRFDKHLRNPENARQYRNALRRGPNDHADYLKRSKLYQGWVLNEALRYPGDVLAQARIQNPMGELRVHTVAGAAPENLIMARHGKVFAKTLGVDRQALREFVERDVMAKLPAKYRKGNFAMDVMPFKNPDGSIGFKVIELNPSERATRAGGGASSGLLDSARRSTAGAEHYRAVTGRHLPSVAGLGAGAAGVGAAAAARALTPAEEVEAKNNGP
jgi:hypothetical protein